MSFPPRVQDLPKSARLEAGQRWRPLVPHLLNMTFLHCWKHPLDPTATSSQLNRNAFGNICGFTNIQCCPEIITPLFGWRYFFSKSMKETWFCYGKVSNVSVVMSQIDSEPFRPISATLGRFSIFLLLQKKHFLDGILILLVSESPYFGHVYLQWKI